MARALKLPLTMAVIIAALVSTASPALAVETLPETTAVLSEQTLAPEEDTAPSSEVLITPGVPEEPEAPAAPDTPAASSAPVAPPKLEAPSAPVPEAELEAPPVPVVSEATEAPAAKATRAPALAAPLAIDSTLPPTPNFTSISSAGNNSFTFQWQLATGDTSSGGGVKVLVWDAATDGSTVGSCSAMATSTTCTINISQPNKQHWATIERSLPNGGSSAPSGRQPLPQRIRPASPTNVTAVLVGNDIKVSWDGVADPVDAPVTAYEISAMANVGDGSPVGTAISADGSARTISFPASEYQFLHGKTAEITVTAVNSVGNSLNSTAVQIQVPQSATKPEFSRLTPTVDGFTIDIANSDPSTITSYIVTASRGTAMIVGSHITVSGLMPGESSRVDVTAVRSGHFNGFAFQTGIALFPAKPAVLSRPIPTNDGYTTTITNFDNQFRYTLSSSLGSVQRNGPEITVSGLQAGVSSQLTVTTSRTGGVSSTVVLDGTSLSDATSSPQFSPSVATADGFTATLLNHDASRTYRLTQPSQGLASLDGDQLTVTGLAPNRGTTLTVHSVKAGEREASTDVTGTSAKAPAIPFTFSDATPTADGWTASIDNYATLFTSYAWFTADTTAGTVAVANGVVTVTGLASNASATVTLTLHGFYTEDSTARASGATLPSYTVTWNENWPDAGAPTVDVTTDNEVGTLPDPSAAGWVITEWNTKADGSGTTVDETTALSSIATSHAVTLFAIWEKRTLSITLSSLSVATADAVSVTATANAAFGTTDDVTTKMVLTSSEPSDAITGADVVAIIAGSRTLTGAFDGATATVQLEVVAGPATTITVTPSSTAAKRGSTLTFTVAGTDAHGNPVTVDPADVTLTSDVATDVVDGLTVTFPTASPHVITATVAALQASVKIEVSIDETVSPPVTPPVTPPTIPPSTVDTPPSTVTPSKASQTPNTPKAPTGLATTGTAPSLGTATLAAMLLALGAVIISRRGSRTHS